MATTQFTDVVIPGSERALAENIQIRTAEKSELIRSGAMVQDSELQEKLSGGSFTFQLSAWDDLDASSEEDTATDDPNDTASTANIGSLTEIAGRLYRTKGWSSMNTTRVLANAQPLDAITDLASGFWNRRLQQAALAVMTGIFADNDAVPTGSEHTQYDLTYDTGGTPVNFTAKEYLNAKQLLGDNGRGPKILWMHSILRTEMQKENLIDAIPDSEGRVSFRTWQGDLIVEDDDMYYDAGSTEITHMYIMNPGFLRYASVLPPDGVATEKVESAGQGSGESRLWNRVQWCIHPTGHKITLNSPGDANGGGFTNTELATATTFQRVYPERKQIGLIRYVVDLDN